MSGDNVVWFGGETRLPIPAEQVLRGALEAGVQDVLVIGTLDGELYTASSTADAGELLLMLERAKRRLMTHVPQ